MVKVYSVVLVVGFIGLLVLVLGGALTGSPGREGKGPGARFGTAGKVSVGALIGFGMGGLSAEFSPLDLSWPVCLAIAAAAALLAVFWVRYAVRQFEA